MNVARVQRKRTKGWRMPENTLYVGRGSKWGNPFPVVEPWLPLDVVRMYRGLVTNRVAYFTDNPNTRWENVQRYRADRWRPGTGGIEVPTVAEVREGLAGKNLACWCPLDQPCHADVLRELANR